MSASCFFYACFSFLAHLFNSLLHKPSHVYSKLKSRCVQWGLLPGQGPNINFSTDIFEPCRAVESLTFNFSLEVTEECKASQDTCKTANDSNLGFRKKKVSTSPSQGRGHSQAKQRCRLNNSDPSPNLGSRLPSECAYICSLKKEKVNKLWQRSEGVRKMERRRRIQSYSENDQSHFAMGTLEGKKQSSTNQSSFQK